MATIRYILFLVLFISASLVVFLVFDSTVPVDVIWDWANAIGYIASGFILLLFIYSGQRRRFQKYSSTFYSGLHQHLGIASLILVAFHAGILLLHDTFLIEHLKITAPIYMLSGLIAVILIGLLTILSLQTIRRKVWARYTSFKLIHGLTGIAILVFTGAHIFGSQYYVNTTIKISVLALLTLLVFSIFLINKYVKYDFSKSPVKTRTPAPVIICYLTSFMLICGAYYYAYTNHGA